MSSMRGGEGREESLVVGEAGREESLGVGEGKREDSLVLGERENSLVAGENGKEESLVLWEQGREGSLMLGEERGEGSSAGEEESAPGDVWHPPAVAAPRRRLVPESVLVELVLMTLEPGVPRLMTPELWSVTKEPGPGLRLGSLPGLLVPMPGLSLAWPRRWLRPVSLASPAPYSLTSSKSSSTSSTSSSTSSTIPLLRVSSASPDARLKEEASWSSVSLLQAGQNQRRRSSTTSAMAVAPSAMQLVWKWKVHRSHMISWSAVSSEMPQTQPILTVTSPWSCEAAVVSCMSASPVVSGMSASSVGSCMSAPPVVSAMPASSVVPGMSASSCPS